MSAALPFVSGIDANRTVKDELTEALSRQGGRRRISVTDLVNPRQAFFRRLRPEIKPDPERLQAMLSGTGFHEVFGRAVSTEEFVEQFVEFQGIVGKIDIYEEFPIELKTTASLPDDIPRSRPAYLDQLGMYCAMTGRTAGRLIVYRRALYGRPAALKAFEVAYADLGAIGKEMVKRRDLLREALTTGDPGHLPKCEWFDLGCDYKAFCGCEGAPPLTRVVPAGEASVVQNRELVTAIGAQLAQAPAPAAHFGLNDLVFPRKSALERRGAAPAGEAEEPADVETQLASFERRGFVDAIKDALWFGIPGAFSRTPVVLRKLKGWVGTFRGVPTIVRSTKIGKMVDRKRLPEQFSHYFDRMAFECALTDHHTGRIVVYYESLAADKFMVYDVRFRKLDEIRAEADRRLALLEAGAPTHELPACPAWMARYCDFAPACGCGSP
jgi:hypothetical protein